MPATPLDCLSCGAMLTLRILPCLLRQYWSLDDARTRFDLYANSGCERLQVLEVRKKAVWQFVTVPEDVVSWRELSGCSALRELSLYEIPTSLLFVPQYGSERDAIRTPRHDKETRISI